MLGRRGRRGRKNDMPIKKNDVLPEENDVVMIQEGCTTALREENVMGAPKQEAELIAQRTRGLREFSASRNGCRFGTVPSELTSFPQVFSAEGTFVCSYEQKGAQSIRLSDDASLGASMHSGDRGVVHIWDARTGSAKKLLSLDRGNWLLRASLAPISLTGGGELVGTCLESRDDRETCRTTVWNTETGDDVFAKEESALWCFLRGQERMFYVHNFDRGLTAYDMRGRREAFSLRPSKETFWAVQRGGDHFVSTDLKTFAVKVWDARTRSVQLTWRFPSEVRLCDISADGRTVAVGRYRRSRAVLCSARDGKVQAVLQCAQPGEGASPDYASPCISSDSSRVLVAHRHGVCVHDTVSLLQGGNEGADRLAVADVVAESPVQALYRDFVVSDEKLSAKAIVDALRNAEGKDVRMNSMRDVQLAHVMVRTLLNRGDKFEQFLPSGEFSLGSFLTIHLYMEMCNLIRTSQEKAMGHRILRDAVDTRMIKEENAVMVRIADIVVTETNKKIDNALRYIMLVDFKVGLLEAKLNSLVQEIKDTQKMQRWAALVKLGCSLIPVVGGCAVALTEAGGQLLLSLEPEHVVDFVTNIFSCGGGTAVDLGWLDRMLGGRKREKDVIKLTLIAFSNEFLDRIDTNVAQMLRRVLEEEFGSVEVLLEMAREILDGEPAEGAGIGDKPQVEEVDTDDESTEKQLSNDSDSCNSPADESMEECVGSIGARASIANAVGALSDNSAPTHKLNGSQAVLACNMANLQMVRQLKDVQVGKWMCEYILEGVTDLGKRDTLQAIIRNGVRACSIHGRRLVGGAPSALSADVLANWMLKKQDLAWLDEEEVQCLRVEIAEFVEKIRCGTL